MKEFDQEGMGTNGSGDQASVYDGLSIQLTPAPFFKRFFAYAIDLGIVTLLIYGVAIALLIIFAGGAGITAVIHRIFSSGSMSDAGPVIIVILIVLGILLLGLAHDSYFIYLEYKRGLTPGKRVFGLKVVSLSGGRLTLGQAALRHLLRYIDCFLVFPGLISVLASSRSQRLGDFVASTLVVHSEQKEIQQNFMYVTSEQYQWFLETYRPAAIAKDVCLTYLKFSYPEYILKTQLSPPENLVQWEQWVKYYLPAVKDAQMDQISLLKVFAEHCFQTVNKK